MRTQKQASTKYNPFFLLYHRQPNHISAVVDSSELTLEDVLNPSAEDHVVSVDEGLSSILDTVRNNVKMAQEKQKSSFQKRALKGVKVFNFSVGDLVLRKNMRNIGRKWDRLAEKWNGPYRVQVSSNQRNVLCGMSGNILKSKVPHVQLKPYMVSQLVPCSTPTTLSAATPMTCSTPTPPFAATTMTCSKPTTPSAATPMTCSTPTPPSAATTMTCSKPTTPSAATPMTCSTPTITSAATTMACSKLTTPSAATPMTCSKPTTPSAATPMTCSTPTIPSVKDAALDLAYVQSLPEDNTSFVKVGSYDLSTSSFKCLQSTLSDEAFRPQFFTSRPVVEVPTYRGESYHL